MENLRLKHPFIFLVRLLVCMSVLFLLACSHRTRSVHGIDIVSGTSITGSVNGAAFENRVSATLNIGHGGRSSCEFSHLPVGFTPGTLSTFA